MTSDLADFIERLLNLLAAVSPPVEGLAKLREDFNHAQRMAWLSQADWEEY